MGQKLRVGTRKGLFTYQKQRSGDWVTEQPAFLGSPVSMLLHDHRNSDLYVALNLGHFGVKLHRADNDTLEWQEIAVPAYPKSDDEDAPALVQIWELVTGGDNRPGVIWAGTIPGGLFRSEDRGESWKLVDTLWNEPRREKWMGGGYDKPGIHSISVHPKNSDQISVAVSSGGVWQSQNNGESWTLEGKGLRAAFLPPEMAYEQLMQDPHRMVVCPARPQRCWIQHHNGIFRSDDGGISFQEITDVKPSVFGFAVVVHPLEPDTAWFVPGIKDEYRVPVDGRLVVTRTRDGGNTFESLSHGLPEQPAYDLVYRHALDIDASGDVLAMGSTTGNLWISEDQGNNWQCLSNHLPPINVVRFDK